MTDVQKSNKNNEDPAMVEKDQKFTEIEIPEEATWGEVLNACCNRSAGDWAKLTIGLSSVLVCLYFFLVGLDVLATGAKVMGGCSAGKLFGEDTNPVAGLMTGIIATVFLQSSSTTTAIVISLCGAGQISVNQGIYMAMGANIGTSVTNTLVALGQLGDGDQLERAFAGATVHDMFNFMSVGLLFPIELITGYLYHLTKACVSSFKTKEGELWVGPIKGIVKPISHKIIVANYGVLKKVAKGTECSDFYPIVCDDMENPTKATCKTGLVGCDLYTGNCPAFFDVHATKEDDQLSGLTALIIGLVMLFACLFGMVLILQRMLLGASTRIIYKATKINGYLAILVGCGITMVIQSSSVTTSTLTPLVGLGVLRVEEMFPLTVGANIGTTLTGIMAALLSTTDGMQVALAHLFFNVTGSLIWYPVPFMRNIPIAAAKSLGKSTRIWRGFPVLYIIVVFLILPFTMLGLSFLFISNVEGLKVLGSIIVAGLALGVLYYGYWYHKLNGKERLNTRMTKMQARRATMESLPEDMESLKADIQMLKERAGLAAPPNKDETVALLTKTVYAPPPVEKDNNDEEDVEC